MHPFQIDPAWYERHWYAPRKPRSALRLASTAASFAGYVIGMAWLLR
jgi:hypothetical protein